MLCMHILCHMLEMTATMGFSWVQWWSAWSMMLNNYSQTLILCDRHATTSITLMLSHNINNSLCFTRQQSMLLHISHVWMLMGKLSKSYKNIELSKKPFSSVVTNQLQKMAPVLCFHLVITGHESLWWHVKYSNQLINKQWLYSFSLIIRCSTKHEYWRPHIKGNKLKDTEGKYGTNVNCNSHVRECTNLTFNTQLFPDWWWINKTWSWVTALGLLPNSEHQWYLKCDREFKKLMIH